MISGRRNFIKFALLAAFAGGISITAYIFGKPQLERLISKNKSDGGVKVFGDKIKMPPPKLKGEISVEEAIARRRSRRDYKEDPLKLEELSNLLWAAQGITEPINKLRAAPSAGATYPLEVYVVIRKGGVEELSEGVYHYNPFEHILEKHIEGDLSIELSSAAISQQWVRDAALNIILTAINERTTERYGQRGIRYIHMEIGHVGENIYLQAESQNLGAVVIGAFYDDWVQQLLSLPENENPLYIIAIGRPS